MKQPITMEQTFCAEFIESFDCINLKMLSGLLSLDYGDPVLRDYFVAGVAYLITIYPVEKADSKNRIGGAVATV